MKSSCVKKSVRRDMWSCCYLSCLISLKKFEIYCHEKQIFMERDWNKANLKIKCFYFICVNSFNCNKFCNRSYLWKHWNRTKLLLLENCDMEAPIVDSTSISSQGTKDRYHFVFISASFLGVVILFPWNILITVTSYWNYKFRNVSLDNNEDIVDPSDEDELTELQLLYTSYLAIASNVPNATFVILHALFGHHFNIKLRLYGSLVSTFGSNDILSVQFLTSF